MLFCGPPVIPLKPNPKGTRGPSQYRSYHIAAVVVTRLTIGAAYEGVLLHITAPDRQHCLDPGQACWAVGPCSSFMNAIEMVHVGTNDVG